MYPADWIWQQYGLCLGWRCSKCKEKVLSRALPFKGLRKRKPDPDEVRDAAEADGKETDTRDQREEPGGKQKAEGGRQNAGGGTP